MQRRNIDQMLGLIQEFAGGMEPNRDSSPELFISSQEPEP